MITTPFLLVDSRNNRKAIALEVNWIMKGCKCSTACAKKTNFADVTKKIENVDQSVVVQTVEIPTIKLMMSLVLQKRAILSSQVVTATLTKCCTCSFQQLIFVLLCVCLCYRNLIKVIFILYLSFTEEHMNLAFSKLPFIFQRRARGMKGRCNSLESLDAFIDF